VQSSELASEVTGKITRALLEAAEGWEFGFDRRSMPQHLEPVW